MSSLGSLGQVVAMQEEAELGEMDPTGRSAWRAMIATLGKLAIG